MGELTNPTRRFSCPLIDIDKDCMLKDIGDFVGCIPIGFFHMFFGRPSALLIG